MNYRLVILSILKTFLFSFPILTLATAQVDSLQVLISISHIYFLYLIRIVFILALLFFLWGLTIFILRAGSEQEREKGKQKMFWGILALTLMFGIWGVVKIIQVAFLGDVFPGAPPISNR